LPFWVMKWGIYVVPPKTYLLFQLAANNSAIVRDQGALMEHLYVLDTAPSAFTQCLVQSLQRPWGGGIINPKLCR
jgi:hypothetical protein